MAKGGGGGSREACPESLPRKKCPWQHGQGWGEGGAREFVGNPLPPLIQGHVLLGMVVGRCFHIRQNYFYRSVLFFFLFYKNAHEVQQGLV